MRLGLAGLLVALAALSLSSCARAWAEFPCEIRVVLSDGGESIVVGTALEWSDGTNSIGKSGEPVEVKKVGSDVKVLFSGKGYQARRLIASPAGGYVRFGGRDYRGRFEFFIGRSGNVVLLNVLPLEDYLLGVVPAEMPSKWPEAALQAQAVAARTYAVSRMLDKRGDTFDVYATVSDQVYSGVAGEHPRTSDAIRATAGQIVTFGGRPIVAYYCSDAGGCTKCGPASQPYLQAVPIESPDSPHNQWSIRLTRDELGKLAEQAGGKIGTVESVRSEQDAASGHLLKLTVVGDKGQAVIKGNTLRSLLGLSTMKSTRAWIEIPGQSVAAALPHKPKPPAGPRRLERQAAGDVVEIAVADEPEPETAQGASDSALIPSYGRPFVRHTKGLGTKKLRTAWLSDGESTVSAARDVLVASAPLLAPAALPATQAIMQLAEVKKTTPTLRPPTAIAGTSGTVGPEGIVIHGSGYGHGMGMSQWGAKTLAERGLSYDQILAYFYSGVRIEAVPRTLGSVAVAAPASPGGGGVAEEPSAHEAVTVQRSKFAPGR